MKVVFALYHDYNFQSRPPECIRALKLLGADDIVLVTIAELNKSIDGVRTVVSKYELKDKLKYPRFYRTVIKTIRKEKPDMVMLHDNYTAPVLAYLLHRKYKGKIVYDSSELYLDMGRKLKDIVFRFFTYSERKYLKYADAVIAANKERGEIMQKEFGLSQMPIVLENMRRIADEVDYDACGEKYGGLFENKEVLHVLYGGGVKENRRTLDLANAVADMGDDVELIIAGPGDPSCVAALREIMNQCPRIKYVGKLPRSEWKYLIQNSDVCVSIYLQDIPNNIYCASGRFFESLFEGVPVLCSENPPMKNNCAKYGFGVSDDDLKRGLSEMKQNYKKYKEKAEQFASSCDYEARIPKLANDIKNRLDIENRLDKINEKRTVCGK